MTTRMSKLISGLVGGLFAAFIVLAASPAAAGGTCNVAWDGSYWAWWGLGGLYAQARATFAESTSFDANGNYVECANGAPGNGCWYYEQPCEDGYVHIDDISGYNHYHLSFSDPAMDISTTGCGFVDPGDGYGSGFEKLESGQCVQPAWVFEPRVLQSHDQSQWIEITDRPTAMTPPSSPTTFALPNITIGGTNPIQLWFLVGNQWYYWSSLQPGYHDLSAWVQNAISVRISGASGTTGPYEVDSFQVTD